MTHVPPEQGVAITDAKPAQDPETAETLPAVRAVAGPETTEPTPASTSFTLVTVKTREEIERELDSSDIPHLRKARTLIARYSKKTEDKATDPIITWNECLNESGEIYFEKVCVLLKGQKRKFAPEFNLALSDNPVHDGPFGLGIFVPIDAQRGKEASDMEQNLEWTFDILLEECKCPEDVRDNIKRKLIERFQRNLTVLRQNHLEVRFNEKGITLAKIKRAFLKAKAGKSRIHQTAKEKCERIIQMTSGDIPESYFGAAHKDSTIQLLVFLHHIGMIDIRTMPEDDILHLLRELGEARVDAIAFLHEGENLFSRMQRGMLKTVLNTENDTTEVPLDTLDLLEQLKNLNLYELVAYAFDEDNRMEWRSQAASIAFIRFKLLNITRNAQYAHAPEVAHRLRDVFTDAETKPSEQLWQYDRTGQLHIKGHVIYSNETHDYSLEKEKVGFNNPETLDFRRWTSPLSNRVYDIRLVDGSQKSEFAILLKILLKNSEGEPSALYDLVRQTVVFAEADFEDPEVRKDVYYFLFCIGERYGLKPATETIDWTNHNAETIYRK